MDWNVMLTQVFIDHHIGSAILCWNVHVFHMFFEVIKFILFLAVDGLQSIQKVLFMKSRSYSKEASQLIASGPYSYLHFWNVFQGGELLAQFPGVGLVSFSGDDLTISTSIVAQLQLTYMHSSFIQFLPVGH